MLFLKMPDWLSKIADSEIMGTVIAGFRTLMFSLCSYVYGLIINLYELFEVLCTARILDSGVLEEMSKRIGIILGLITLFYVVFSFVKMLIDPDKISDKEAGAGAIIKKVILVIILLGVSNFGFKLLYKIQVLIMENHVVSRLILPYQPEDEDMDKFGNYLSEQLFLSFYHVENFDTSELASSDGENNLMLCSQGVDSFRLQIRNHGRFELGYTCLNESVPINVVSETTGAVEQDETFVINFNVVLAPVAGIAVAYLLLMYCFSVGVRMVQLAFLEVIAPIAIVGYLAPKKENMLTKWAGIYFSTYIDAFIRIAIINFVVFIIFVIFSSGSDLFEAKTFWLSVGDPQDFKTRSIFTVVVIISLLTFAKKAPDLLKEIMPSTGKAKLGFGAKVKDFVGLGAGLGLAAGVGIGTLGRVPGALSNTGRAIGMIKDAKGWGKLGAVGRALGTAAGETVGLATGGISGAFRGGVAGNKAKGGMFSAMRAGQQAQAKANLTRAQRQLAGGRWYSDIPGFFNQATGNVSNYEILEAEYSSYKDIKADIDDDDGVKDALSTFDAQYQRYVTYFEF